MKLFVQPVVEVERIAVCDVVTTSNEQGGGNTGAGGLPPVPF